MHLASNTAICSSKYLQISNSRSTNYQVWGMGLRSNTRAVVPEGITPNDNRGVFIDLNEGKYDSCALVKDWNWVVLWLFHAHASCHQERSSQVSFKHQRTEKTFKFLGVSTSRSECGPMEGRRRQL